MNDNGISGRCAVLVLSALLLAAGCAREAGTDASAGSDSSAPEPPDRTRLVGKWQRPDGGYVLDIRGAAQGGELDAGYFNPDPIHVAKATWEESAELGLSIFVELRDVGYPGATYRLRYRAADDRLFGAYTQPAAGQTFEVLFVRQP